MKTLSTLLLLLFVSAVCSCETTSKPQPTPQTANLRGYGVVSEEDLPGKSVFACQDTKHADILLGKLLADLFWNAGTALKTSTVKVGPTNAVIHEFQPYGAIIAFRNGAQVVVLGNAEPQKLEAQAAQEPLLQGADVRFEPASPYPAYLDSYDLRSVRFRDNPMRSLASPALQSHWDFAKKFGTGGIALSTLGFGASSPAAGVIDWGPTDYVFEQAKKNGDIVTLMLQTTGILPLWFYNSAPQTRAATFPSVVTDAFAGGGPKSSGVLFESYGTTDAERQQGSYEFLRQVVKRYGSDPNLGAWMPWVGEPGGEFAYGERETMFLDDSPAAQEAFRVWLAHTKGWNLGDIGQRWYGDAHHFSNWSQVVPPDVNSFFGDPFAPDSLNLAGSWEWQLAPVGTVVPPASGAPLPGLNNALWVPFATVPSQQVSLLPHGHAFYRKQFKADEAAARDQKFLVVDAYVRAGNPVSVWLNGAYLGQEATETHPGMFSSHDQFALNVAGKLKSGDNELVIEVPAAGSEGTEGRLLGSVFFTPTKPAVYPYLGPFGNARFVDLRDWQIYGYYTISKSAFNEFRALDPDRPTIISGDDYYDVGDYAGELASLYGLGFEDTGREVYYRPRPGGHGLIGGYYGTSEESATVSTAAGLERELGWILFDGDAAHLFFYRIDDYMKVENQSGWFTQRANLLKLVGKSMREKPDVVLLVDPETQRLGFLDPQKNDIGGAVLEQMHIDCGYATPSDIENGLTDGYPIIFDCTTRVMDQKLIEAIQRYVERGGTFVACPDSGRNTPILPDSWPISQLTGFKVRATNESGNVTFSTSMPVANALAGIKFPGADNAGFSLESAAGGTQALATWADGTTAIGYRQIGNGRVIFVGIHRLPYFGFSLNQPAPGGGVASERIGAVLLKGLGANRTSFSANPDIWTRKFVTKNGLQYWLIANNATKNPATADVSMKVDTKPTEVDDMETGAKADFSYTDDGWVHVHSVSFGPNGTHVFGVRRGSLLDGVQVWWQEKLKYWQIKQAATPSPIVTSDPGNIAIGTWKFSTDTDGRLATDPTWKTSAFDDSKWKSLPNSPWRSLSPELTLHRGTSLYRAPVTIPPAWEGHEICLNFYSYDTPVVFGQAKFSLDGKEVANYNPVPGFGFSQLLNYDISDAAKPGNHLLSVSVAHVASLDEVGGPFISGVIWISALPRLVDPIDLKANWEAVGDNWLTTQPFSAPGTIDAKYLRRTVAIPAAWKDKSIFLKLATPSGAFGTILVNGALIDESKNLQPFGTIALVNLTPYLHAGTDNTIELWPTAIVQNYDSAPNHQHATIKVTNVQIGAVDPRDLPVRQ
jgi:hypothetical protein